jgi:hypothetical protein
MLSLWPFSTEYFVRNWGVLGGSHFIAVATGINLAFLGWQAFRDRVRSAERRLEEKINSVAASASDVPDASHYRQLIDKLLLPVLAIRLWAWAFLYLLALIAAAVGIAMLYCHTKSPYDMFLLLPTVVQLLVSWTTLAMMTIWMWLMRKGMTFFGPKIPSRHDASAQVTSMLQEEKQKLEKEM